MLRAAKWAAVFVVATAAFALPHPLPPPDAATGEAYARKVMAQFTPAQLERALFEDPIQTAATLQNFSAALLTSDVVLEMRAARYLNALTAARARRVDRNLTKEGVRDVVTFMVGDPIRFTDAREAMFRARVLAHLPQALDSTFSAVLRAACLRELNLPLGLDFDESEKIAAAWGSIQHRSSERRAEFSNDLTMPDDLSGPIETSIYSINSGFFFTSDDARAFLRAVRASAPKRRIVVLADTTMAAALKDIDVEIAPTFSRMYTPWPRDPFTVAYSAGGVTLVNRPNLQPEREEDANMARALVQNNLDARWTVAPIPFHNGHILLTPDAIWLSIHSVEIRALQILGLDAVPTRTFHTKEGIEKYLNAVRQAAKELERLYGRPARFVHPLAADAALMSSLAGGAGFDLDSILTMLPQRDGSLVALAGDISLGAKLAANGDWKLANKVYGLKRGIAAAQKQKKNAALGTFLDIVAAHLASNGVKVQRLPLLNVPASLATDVPKDFLLTWNNVVLEADGDRRRAEGFAMLFGAGDDYARKVFATAGYELELFPPLVKSVTHSGGYRCASNHIRPAGSRRSEDATAP